MVAKSPELIAFEKKYCDPFNRKTEKELGIKINNDTFMTCSGDITHNGIRMHTSKGCKHFDENTGWCVPWERDLKKFWADYPKNTVKRVQKPRGRK